MRQTTDTVRPFTGPLLDAPRRCAERLAAVPPAAVLVPLVGAHLAIVAGVALSAAHNGWLWSTPGRGIQDWTAAWALGHLWVPADPGAYGTAVVLWPVALAFGGSLPAALPVIVVAQVAVVAPLVVLAIYGLAARIGGRLFGYAAVAGWIVAPLLTLGFFYAGERTFQGIPYSDFRGLVHDTVLPNALGLTLFAGFASLGVLVASAWLLVRFLDSGDLNELFLSGLVAGFAVGIDATNVLFLPAPILALVVARRWRELGVFTITLTPALATLVLWRWTGRGDALGFEPFPFTWSDLDVNVVHFRGAGWSLLLFLWIVVAGIFALVRKSPAKGALVAAWVTAYFVLESGSLTRGRVLDGSLFDLLVPAYAAFVLVASAAAVLLFPGLGRRRADARPAAVPLRASRGLVVAFVVLAVYPLVIVSLAAPVPGGRIVSQGAHGQSVVVSGAFDLRVERKRGATTLTWARPPADGVALRYRVYRSPGAGCARATTSAQECRLRMAAVTTVAETTWSDPDAGSFTYRVAAVDGREGRARGHVLLISPPAS